MAASPELSAAPSELHPELNLAVQVPLNSLHRFCLSLARSVAPRAGTRLAMPMNRAPLPWPSRGQALRFSPSTSPQVILTSAPPPHPPRDRIPSLNRHPASFGRAAHGRLAAGHRGPVEDYRLASLQLPRTHCQDAHVGGRVTYPSSQALDASNAGWHCRGRGLYTVAAPWCPRSEPSVPGIGQRQPWGQILITRTASRRSSDALCLNPEDRPAPAPCPLPLPLEPEERARWSCLKEMARSLYKNGVQKTN